MVTKGSSVSSDCRFWPDLFCMKAQGPTTYYAEQEEAWASFFTAARWTGIPLNRIAEETSSLSGLGLFEFV